MALADLNPRSTSKYLIAADLTGAAGKLLTIDIGATATAGVTPTDFTQNHDAVSAPSLSQDTQAQFVLERKVVDSSVINVAQHGSHSSHSSHSSHASSRY